MKNLFFVFAILIVGLSACNKEKVPVQLDSVNVGFEIIQADYTAPLGLHANLKSDGPYDRGTAPAYVSGLEVEVVNNTYAGYNFTSQYDFMEYGTTGGMPMVIEDVVVGNNTFKASSMAENDAINGIYEIARIPDTEVDATAFEERAFEYSNLLDELQPLYMKFTSSEEKLIAVDQENTIAFNLQAINSRINLILEGVPNFKAKIMVTTPSGLVEATSFATGDNAVAIVLNDDLIREVNGELEIAFDFYDPDENWHDFALRYISIKNGQKITRVYKYNGEEMSDAGFTATYQPVIEDNGGEVL